MTDIDNATTTYDQDHRRLPGGGFTCERPDCTHVNGQAVLIERDLARELADVGQQPPDPGLGPHPWPSAFLSSCRCCT
ncbi:hypothetical protein [Micromonospora sp. C31]|uniref:hypothetical protein n=1 Tax=Micromonospora sp. C31 TaxID=2824876 RepID=UPI001FFD7C48|nr:hypothetical protein [Micromonospora sp. C31]